MPNALATRIRYVKAGEARVRRRLAIKAGNEEALRYLAEKNRLAAIEAGKEEALRHALAEKLKPRPDPAPAAVVIITDDEIDQAWAGRRTISLLEEQPPWRTGRNRKRQWLTLNWFRQRCGVPDEQRLGSVVKTQMDQWHIDHGICGDDARCPGILSVREPIGYLELRQRAAESSTRARGYARLVASRMHIACPICGLEIFHLIPDQRASNMLCRYDQEGEANGQEAARKTVKPAVLTFKLDTVSKSKWRSLTPAQKAEEQQKRASGDRAQKRNRGGKLKRWAGSKPNNQPERPAGTV